MKTNFADLVIQLLIIACCFAPIVVAYRLEPDDRGLGTHEQLGWEPCSWLEVQRRPCPTCGMTTAFSNTVRFRLGAAFMANPAGLLLCLLCFFIPIYILRSWLIGEPPGRFFYGRWGRIWPTILVLAVLLGWIFKLVTHDPS